METTQKIAVIIPAAGIGKRMASNQAKQYLKIGHMTVLEHTLKCFLSHDAVDTVVVVLNKEDKQFSKLDISYSSKIFTVIGGEERVDSVLAGLKFVKRLNNPSWVMVHDAARPCLQHADIDKLISTAFSSQGAILASPIVDTVKSANAEQLSINKTIDRRLLWRALTPQMFKLNQLIDAIDLALTNQINITDEASAMEYSGYSVKLVEGSPSNIKITRPPDLSLANFYLSQNKELKETT